MTVHLERDAGVATVMLDRPSRLNALDSDTLAALSEVLKQAADPDTRALVLRGAGEAFSAGADVEELVDLDVEAATAYVDRAQAVTSALTGFPAPTVAAIDGYCLGGGWELALCCDLRVASEDAVLGHTEIDLAVVPAWGGLDRLLTLVDDETARRLVYFGERVDAQDAHELGLVGDVVAADQLDDQVATLADDLADKPPFALRATKEAIAATELPEADGRRYRRRLWGSLFGTDAQRSAMAAFLE